jgi:hypothetical protein
VVAALGERVERRLLDHLPAFGGAESLAGFR